MVLIGMKILLKCRNLLLLIDFDNRSNSFLQRMRKSSKIALDRLFHNCYSLSFCYSRNNISGKFINNLIDKNENGEI